MKDEQSVNYLVQLYASENDREVKKAIINGFDSSQGNSGFYFAGGYNPVQKSTIAAGDKPQTQGVEFAKLLKIARAEKDVELRRLAFSNLQRFGE